MSNKESAPLLVLIDGMALAYRSYFAFISHPLTNAKGENTSAVFGFVNALLHFLEQHKPQYAAVCFDTSAPTFRHVMYKEYKATREAMPDDMRPQIKMIKDIVRAYHIPQLEMPGYEADDLIGTLAKMAEKKNIYTSIVTPDKDFSQLVTDYITLVRPTRDSNPLEEITVDGVKAKYGLRPDQFIDYLALVGDASDNIPGVKGVGEKTATPLLTEYETLDGIYANLDKITKKALKEKLTNDKTNAYLSRELATINIAVPLEMTVDDLAYKFNPDFEKLQEMFKDLNFKSLLAKLNAEKRMVESGEVIEHKPAKEYAPILDDEITAAEEHIGTREHKYHTVYTLTEVFALAKKLDKQSAFAFDMETTSARAMEAQPIGISFSWKPGEAYYIPLRLSDSVADPESLFSSAPGASTTKNATNTGFDSQQVLDIFKPALEDETKKKIGQNIKYDMLVLKNYGINVHPIGFDTMVAASLLQNEGAYSMDDLSQKYLGYTPIALSEIAGKLKRDTSNEVMASLDTDKLAEYGAEDSDVTIQLYEKLEKEIRSENLITLCEEIEFPTIEALTKVEFNGVKLDTDLLSRASKEMEEESHRVTEKIFEYAGKEFDINSTKQLADVLFNKLMLQPIKKTKTGYSTDAQVLEELKVQHPIATEILAYRQYQKLKSTYVDVLPSLVNKRTGLIHTSYNQAVAATGRLSSNDPNLQNIPVKTEMGRALRKAFVSRFKKGQILSADYSQIELRIVAHFTKDENLLKSFSEKEDIHTNTSAAVFGVAKKDVTREMRRRAKEVNYGIMYGMGAFGLASRLGIPQSEAKDIITKYFTAFPSIRDFIEETKSFVRENGYAETLKGRRRYFPNINASNQSLRGAAERAAINMPIQGTAAEMIKIAMINIQRKLEDEKMKSLMIMQVHDELVFDIYPGEADTMKSIVLDLMSSAIPMDVVIEVDAGIGSTWFDAH